VLSAIVASAAEPAQLLPARTQMAFTLGIHIVLVPFGVAFVAMALFANYRGLRQGDEIALRLAERWSRVAAVLFAVGLVTFPTLVQALIVPILYFGFTTLEGHFITPSIMGRRLALNPLTVFLALIFWTWLWGPVGAFLAVPLLIVALVAINHLFPQEERVLPG